MNARVLVRYPALVLALLLLLPALLAPRASHGQASGALRILPSITFAGGELR
jgi:hypothetical protein